MLMRTQPIVLLATILTVVFFWLTPATQAFRVDEQKLAALEFPAPDSPHAVKYLGLSAKDKFRLSHIKAETVLVEIFSMYCPICQAEASRVNEIYHIIERDPHLKGAVKLLGVGTGNTPFEVDVFKKKYEVPFPLVPDENMGVQKAFSDQIRTPTFLIVEIGGGNKIKVQNLHIGRIENLVEFSKTLFAVSGKR
jgi:thiol-disulfide isomerase/thioredoxin